MPRLMPQLVPVSRIHCQIPASQYPPDSVAAAAADILTAGALAVPLVVRPFGDDWRLIDGAFAYHAAVKAREIDPLAGEKVLAFVVEGGLDPVTQALKRGRDKFWLH